MVGCVHEGWFFEVALLCFVLVTDISLSLDMAENSSGMYSYFFGINIGVTSLF